MRKISFLLAILFIAVPIARAAETSVSTDDGWLSKIEAPDEYSHVRDGSIDIDIEEYINRYREKLGVPTFEISDELRTSAANHASYLTTHNSTYDPHGETEGKSGYTGSTTTERCQYAGFEYVCTEVQASGSGDMFSALDALMMTPFHRVSLMYPYFTYIGCAQDGTNVVCDIGYPIENYGDEFTQETDPVTYPADGQVISTTFYVSESPMPYPAYAYEFIGPTLMYWPLGVDEPEATVSVYDLTDEVFIETFVSVNTASPYAWDAIFFNPIEELELDHEYAVHVEDASGEDQFSATWTFKTQQSSNIDFPNADQAIVYDRHVDWADPSGAEELWTVPLETTSDRASSVSESTQELIDRLAGWIMLAVDQNGEAWYIDPVTELRYYLADGPTAYEFLRSFGLGITDANLEKIPTEDDAYGGGSLAESLSGRILLQVEQNGEAWYVHPGDLKRYYMADGDEAYRIMRELSEGTYMEWIEDIPAGSIE